MLRALCSPWPSTITGSKGPAPLRADTSTAAGRTRRCGACYFFGDYCSGRLYAMATPRSLATAGPLPWTRAAEIGAAIASFGEDHDGELYVADLAGGRILRVVAQ